MLENTFFVTHTNFYQGLRRRIRGDNPGKGVGFGWRPIPVANVTANQRLLCRLIERPSCIWVGARLSDGREEASMTPLGASAVIGVACKKPGRGLRPQLPPDVPPRDTTPDEVNCGGMAAEHLCQSLG
jgi:hypothetical protein